MGRLKEIGRTDLAETGYGRHEHGRKWHCPTGVGAIIHVQPFGPLAGGWTFKHDWGPGRVLGALNLHKLSMSAAIRGARKAAKEKEITCLWAHLHEFRTEKDFEKLRYSFGRVSQHVNQGNLLSITMVDLARKIHN